MPHVDRRLFENVDWLLLAAAGAVLSLSALTLANVTVSRAGEALVLRQLVWVGVGSVLLVMVACVDYRNLVRVAPVVYLLGLLGLGAVLVAGRSISGARRWIPMGPVSVQPSELFKIAFILMVIWVLTSRWAEPLGKAALGLSAAVLAVPFVLIVRQPDLGSALVLLPVLILLLVGAGLRPRLLGGVALVGLTAMPLGWFALKEYQRERLLVYLDPYRDPLGTAYNVIQAKIAIGSGQLLGKGIAGATQSRLAFLPERHTDFIFAVFAEMWGFVGCLVLILCYAVLITRGFEIAATAREPIGRLLAIGVTALLATQTLVNLGMATGLLPIVGIPLPLMSYGGSSMMVSMTALGLLLSIRMRQFT